MKIHQYCVYIITNDSNNVLYTGVTSDLADRILQHKEKINRGSRRDINVASLFIMKSFKGYKML